MNKVSARVKRNSINIGVESNNSPFVLTGRVFPSQYLYTGNMETDLKNKSIFGRNKKENVSTAGPEAQ